MKRVPEPQYMDLPAEADAYAAADFSEVNQAFAERLLDLAWPLDSVRAVDLGTGPGDIPVRVLTTLAHRDPGRAGSWRIIGVDASEAMLAHARRLGHQTGLDEVLQWLHADAIHTSLAVASVDVVFSNSILHHLSRPADFWAEIRRIVRPGGLIFLRDLARPGDEHQARQIVHTYAGGESALLQEEFYRSLLAAYTPQEVRDQLRKARLDSLTVTTPTDRHLDVQGYIKGI